MRYIAASMMLVSTMCLRAQDLCQYGASCHVVQASSYKTTFEHLSVAFVGNGRILKLAGTPSSQYPVHVFRNGLEISPGVDYSVKGSTVTLIGSLIGGTGDQFDVSYVQQAVDTSPSDSSTTQSRGVEQGRATAVLNRYLEQSLGREIAGNSGPRELARRAVSVDGEAAPRPGAQSLAAPSRYMGDRDTYRRGVGSGKEPESIRMLSLVMSRNVERSTASASKRKKKKSKEEAFSDVVSGAEGIGDAPTSSPYSILSLAPGGLGNALNGMDSSAGALPRGSRSTVRTRLQSLRLLEQRLGAAE